MTPKLTDELDQALDEHHGFVKAEGRQGKVILMSMLLFRERDFKGNILHFRNAGGG